MLVHITKTTRRFFVPLFTFCLLLYPKFVIGLTHDSHYIMHKCDKTNDTYISGSTFQSALYDILFSKLPAKVLQATFYSFTNGTGIDQVNALYYCRGDVDGLACHNCVLAAADKIIAKCEFIKEAIVWFEECTLRYANRSISSIDEESPMYTYTNKSGIMNDHFLDPFKDKFDSAMDEVIKQAAYSRILQGFATTQVNLSSSEVLHCVVQCTPDIIGAPCDRCLTSALNQRDKWGDTMILMPSCFIRVDLYNSTTPPTSISTHSHSHGLSTIMIVVIAVVSGIVAIAAIIAAVFCYFHYYYYPHLKGVTRLKKFTYAQLAEATADFNPDNLLGSGSSASVYKGALKSGEKVAVKRINEWNCQPKEFISELNNSNVNHTNIIKLVGYCSKAMHRMIVYELAENNSLLNHLKASTEAGGHRKLTWENRMKIAVGTASALKYLHKECNTKIIHRDIKTSNILLDSDYEPKVSDFGLAKVFPKDKSQVSTDEVKGTLGYVDPAYFESTKVTEKTDVYSFGIVLLELITGKSPWNLENGPQNTLLSLLQGLPNPASNGLQGIPNPASNDSASNGPEGFASDGPNGSTSNGPNGSTSDGQRGSTSNGPNGSPSNGQRDSTSDGQYDSASDNLQDPVSIDLRNRASEISECLIEPAEGLNNPALKLVDPNLEEEYVADEMACMIICAALCVHYSPQFRLDMSQVVQLLKYKSLPRSQLTDVIANVGSGNEPESSSANSYPETLLLDNLTNLATRVLKKNTFSCSSTRENPLSEPDFTNATTQDSHLCELN